MKFLKSAGRDNTRNLVQSSPKIDMKITYRCICMNAIVHMYGRPILFMGYSYLESYIEGSNRIWQLQVHRAGGARWQDTAENHRSPPQEVLRRRGGPAGGTERFPTKPFYHRYIYTWATGVGAEETNSVV